MTKVYLRTCCMSGDVSKQCFIMVNEVKQNNAPLRLIFLQEILFGLTDRKLLVSIQILNFFCSGLAHWLDEFKRVEADDGYIEEAP